MNFDFEEQKKEEVVNYSLQDEIPKNDQDAALEYQMNNNPSFASLPSSSPSSSSSTTTFPPLRQPSPMYSYQNPTNPPHPNYLAQSLSSNFLYNDGGPRVDIPEITRPSTPIRQKYQHSFGAGGSRPTTPMKMPLNSNYFSSGNSMSSSISTPSLLSEFGGGIGGLNSSLRQQTTKEKEKGKYVYQDGKRQKRKEKNKSEKNQENKDGSEEEEEEEEADEENDALADDKREKEKIYNEWTDDLEHLLSCIRQNSVILYKYHLTRYYQYKRYLPFFKIPVLILSAFNSVFSVGLQPYMEQSQISVLNCLVSLSITIINSIEMYMGIQKSMETEMMASQGFYLLSINIFKILKLKRENREHAGLLTLTEAFNTFQDLVKKSKLIDRDDILDLLIPLEESVENLLSHPGFYKREEEKELHSLGRVKRGGKIETIQKKKDNFQENSEQQQKNQQEQAQDKQKKNQNQNKNEKIEEFSQISSAFDEKQLQLNQQQIQQHLSSSSAILIPSHQNKSILDIDLDKAESLLIKRLYNRLEVKMMNPENSYQTITNNNNINNNLNNNNNS